MSHILHINSGKGVAARNFCGKEDVPCADLPTHFRVPNPRRYVTGDIDRDEHPFTEWCEECQNHPDYALELLGNV